LGKKGKSTNRRNERRRLIKEVKLTDFGAASQKALGLGLSKEDERSAKLAERARNGDYDDGISFFRIFCALIKPMGILD